MDLAAAMAAGVGDNYAAPPMSDYMEIQTLYEPANYEYAITTSCFDNSQELFWTGNSDGRVSSYYSMSMDKYSSFKVQNGVDIRSIYPHMSSDIFVLTPDHLACYSKFGYSNFKHSEVSFSNLQCLYYMTLQQRFLLGGYGNFLFDFDIDRMRILRQISITEEQSDCILIKSSSSSPANPTGGGGRGVSSGVLCTGATNGLIILRDPATLKSIHRFHPHSGNLSDFDVNGNLLVSCGFALTRSGLQVDRFLMCYDLRMMRSLNPIQLLIEPCYLHFLPVCSSVVAVASQSGCFLLTDTNLMNTPSTIYQAQLPPISGIATTFSMSSNCQAFAFGHSSGSLHLFTKGDNSLFNDYPEPTAFIDQPQFGQTYIDINDEMASLSSVPVPITFETNPVSDWPCDTNSKYRPTPKISSEIMENARVLNNIMSVPNRVGLKRNQIFNEAYQSHLTNLVEMSKKTSYDLNDLLKEINDAAEKDQTITSDDTNTTVEETTTTTASDSTTTEQPEIEKADEKSDEKNEEKKTTTVENS